MISRPVTKEFIFLQLENLSPDGLLDVAQFIEFLQFQARHPRQKGAARKHAAFGIWADRPEVKDPAAFARNLRQKIETRQDA